ncbi:unnamed protein product (macronuclear) [Paramecium tetraurelia]|uniref:Uncharacterized protein n=1 Tax=Paramecium tetraurelia TaxID=5888 RepID=A0CPH6_PARTE|nr:uncharacterized protein GSPATT00009085001 [Paramecium tetraurelia]CAK72693.1 unnamed protein product [Paramecium tetraurelia]|eukprot:XP_001440090.1 hypothetical protein (macronuclear) [Paramecium tetraurelia strain d4-2]
MQRLSSLFFGFGLGIIGMSLLLDPWGQEKFERMARETARLENSILGNVDLYLQMRNVLGYVFIACSFITINRYLLLTIRIAILYILQIPVLFFYAAINYNHILYKSERFGGNQVILGAILFLAISGAICDGLISPKVQAISTEKEKTQEKPKIE